MLLGFGSHHGTVAAGDAWGAPMEEMVVPPAREAAARALRVPAAPAFEPETYPTGV